jgi:hypothetical protein
MYVTGVLTGGLCAATSLLVQRAHASGVSDAVPVRPGAALRGG